MNKFTPRIDHHSITFNLTEDFPDSIGRLKEKANELVEVLGLDVVKEVYHVFDPVGITLVFILSQSHMAIHTWPESRLMHIDLVSCVGLEQNVLDSGVKGVFLKNGITNYSIK